MVHATVRLLGLGMSASAGASGAAGGSGGVCASTAPLTGDPPWQFCDTHHTHKPISRGRSLLIVVRVVSFRWRWPL